MTTFRAGLLAWGLLVAAAGGTLIYSATLQALTPFQVIVTALAATGVVLAVAAVIPRRESSELLDRGVGEEQSLDAGGTEIDLGNR